MPSSDVVMGFIDEILRANKGRDTELLSMKLEAMRETAFGFLRGSCALFFEDLASRGKSEEPLVWSCGDLHLANFGSYRAGNDLVYFDIADFDEGLLAPMSFDVVRLAASFVVAAHDAGLSRKTSAMLVTSVVNAYRDTAAGRRSYWVERSTAKGVVRRLLRKVKRRTTAALVKSRTRVDRSGRRRIKCDGDHALKADVAGDQLARSVLRKGGRADTALRRFRPIDVAKRIAGLASLGLPRFVMLSRKGANGRESLLDIKATQHSAVDHYSPALQPRFASEAERIVTIQLMLQAAAPALLVPVRVGSSSFVVRELEPTADKIAPENLRQDQHAWQTLAETLGTATAWSHLRAAGRKNASEPEKIAAACTAGWARGQVKKIQRQADLSIERWREFRRRGFDL